MLNNIDRNYKNVDNSRLPPIRTTILVVPPHLPDMYFEALHLETVKLQHSEKKKKKKKKGVLLSLSNYIF